MIPHGVEVFVALDPVDLRWSFDRLAGLCQERLRCDARCGALFVFFGRRRQALKVLFFDGTGMCLFYKRLDRGTFQVPEAYDENGAVMVDERVLEDLLDGVAVETGERDVRTLVKH